MLPYPKFVAYTVRPSGRRPADTVRKAVRAGVNLYESTDVDPAIFIDVAQHESVANGFSNYEGLRSTTQERDMDDGVSDLIWLHLEMPTQLHVLMWRVHCSCHLGIGCRSIILVTPVTATNASDRGPQVSIIA